MTVRPRRLASSIAARTSWPPMPRPSRARGTPVWISISRSPSSSYTSSATWPSASTMKREAAGSSTTRGVSVTMPIVAGSRGAEPAGHVETEKVGRRDGAQVRLERPEPLLAEGRGPAGPQVIEDTCRPHQAVGATRREPHDFPPGIARICAALDIAEAFQRVDGLGRGLLGHAQPPAQLRGRRPARADGLEDEAMHRPHVGMALASQLGMNAVDEDPEGEQQAQRQLKAGRVMVP